ncbi:putative Ig domain-containing protein [Maribacter sp. 1_2014MBL_MicDiv]|uniref:putative Ig domain-containing protein n=1 Tax=Maribacter sp. 1_2014MBL_MicDiv TaxID=1644130 RepID=UPI000AF95153|nr:putative Ig domain-containing protein [Maribacter sp. 1_2014MBL_MicDiv]
MLFVIGLSQMNAQINFDQSTLDVNGFDSFDSGITALEFGPDGKLYVAEYTGAIKILTVDKQAANSYIVTDMEILNSITDIQNHNDDGTVSSLTARETTGIRVVGTAQNPIIYVSSSDIRIGGDTNKGDTNLDTNSGIITRITKTGSVWTAVDIVRGLPRSEENHATNGIQFITIGGIDYLLVAQGGHTNGGGPSNNFAFITEYALSGAVLSINLTALDALPILTDSDGRNFIYDLPTVDDPTRNNANGIEDPNDPTYDGVDINDPFGGNDGLNQAKLVPGGPVQIFSPGYRNAYDLVITQTGAVYITDNGANVGWGGFPVNEGTAFVNNDYDPNETGGGGISNPAPDGEYINNLDHLELITSDVQNYTFGSYYGGHPNPIRANPVSAGLYTDDGTNAFFRTKTYDPNADGSDPNTTANTAEALPADWPPVPVNLANPVEGDWRGPGLPNPEGPVDAIITGWGTNTNAIVEYTSGNFDGAMEGDLLAGVNTGVIRRVELEPDGSLETLSNNFITGIGGNALGLTAQGEGDIFPGTIWTGTLNGSLIIIEPADAIDCIDPADPLYDPLADYDNDGYTNQDEVDNGTEPCNGGSQPDDFDKSAGAPFISNLNDSDDDNDGIADSDDPFQLGDPESGGSDAFTLPIQNDLLNDQQGIGGIFGLGMTGLMNNGNTGPNWLDWIDRRAEEGDPYDPNEPNDNDVLGGAPGIMTSHMRWGTAKGTSNDQEKAYQMGVQVSNATGNFTIETWMKNFDSNLQLYGNTSAVGGELGLFLGTGFQDNFVQFVITQDGLSAIQEVNDVLDTANALFLPLAEVDRPSSNLFLYIDVNPVTGDLRFDYKIENGIKQTLGTITATGSTLAAIQNANTDLAVGFIGTSNTTGVELEGSWEYLKVSTNVPSIVAQLPDLTRYINSNDDVIELDNYFDDNDGVSNLIYSLEDNSNTAVGAVINGNELTINYPGTAEITNITIRATDEESNIIEQSFEVNVTDSPIVLYRVNAGGPQIAAIDGDIDWDEDTQSSNSTYLTTAGSNQNFSFDANAGASVPNTTPNDIFKTERADSAPGAPNMTYSFPVTQSGNYEVRLYLANGWEGTSEAEQRLFDVQMEGLTYPALDNIDLSGTYGHEEGVMISHIIPVTDGNIDIVFAHGAIENPIINGIEILVASDSDTPIYVADIEEQRTPVGEQLDGSLTVIAFGGDGNNKNYTAVGLPPGLVIEPTNGQIGGTVEAGAELNSPYAVTITVDDEDGLSSDAVTITFDWIIFEAFSNRVNVGGDLVTATDTATDWKFNNNNGAYTSSMYSVNTGFSINALLEFNKKHSTVPAYIDNATFDGIFGRERYDAAGGEEMEFVFPLDNGDYVVNIYLGNSYEPANEIGDRIFDISLEGAVVENDLDIIDEFGHLRAGMLSYPVTLNDGELNLEFLHGVAENPILSAIEIFEINAANPTLSIATIANQTSDIDAVVDIMASASGGDSAEELIYYISGQPDGISINAATGQITGTIATTASTGGPNNNGAHEVVVTAVRPGSAPASTVFNWNIASTWVDKDEDENYTARHENSFVQAGDKFYLMGGRENASTIDVYDYTSDSWNSLVDSAPFEFNHFQATEYQGLIWVIGSFKDNAFPTETPAEYVWAFDPANEEWIQGPEIPANRRRGSAGLVMYNNKFYVVAGNTQGHDGGYVSYFDEYDPATGIWTPLTDAPRERDHFAAVVIDDKLYVSGGRLSGGAGGVFAPTIPEVDVYDFSNESWSTLPAGQNIPTPRGGSSAVNFNDKLMVIGGESEMAGPALTTVEEYDPLSQTWATLPGLNHPRHGTQAIVSGNGIFILAGSPVQGGDNQKNMEYYGEDAPVGSPSVASEVNSLDGILIADGETEALDLNIENGNVGVMITSMIISGANASDFSIDSGELTNQLLNPNSTHPIEITLNGTGDNRSALLTITFGNGTTKEITLSNAVNVPEITDPGTQNSNEGEVVLLQIDATGACTNEIYSATGLPAGLSIDPDTGEITGTVSNGGAGTGAYQENNGLVVIEMENLTYGPNWTEETTESGYTGSGYLFNSVDSFNTPGNGTITTEVEISTPGIYRFQWYNNIGIIASTNASTEHNDAWLRFDDADDFYGAKNVDGSGGIVYPKGLGKSPEVEGASANGWLKVYTNTLDWSWSTKTSDNDAHWVFVEFDNAGTYTMEISSRSDGHLIDRVALHLVGQNYDEAQLFAATESSQAGGSGGAAENSPYNVEVTVTDDCSPSQSNTIGFVWNVGEAGNAAPVALIESDVISGDATLTVNFTGDNSSDDTGIVEYLWDFKDGSPTDATANPVHDFETPGVYEVELTVSDGVLTDTDVVTITVNAPANEAPVVTNPGDQNGIEGNVVSLQIEATDLEDDNMIYTAINLPDGLTIDTTTGLISGTLEAGASTNSPFAVDITVTDDGSPSEASTISFTWTVTDVAVNLAPVVTNPGDQNGVEGDVVSLQIEAVDGEGDDMTFDATNLPDGLTIDTTTGLISGTIIAGASTNSPFTVAVTVTDDGSPSEASGISFTWTVTDVAVNLAPVVTNPSDQNGVEGDVVSLQIEAIDGEGDDMTFTASILPDGLTIDASTGLISGIITAGASTNSPFAVAVTVTDDGSPSEASTISFTWTVTDVAVNLAPVVSNPGDQNGVEGNVVSLQIEAVDGEGDDMTFAALNLPDGLTIDTSTGLISGTITAGASTNSPFAVEVTVTDDGSPSEASTISFTWTVTDVAVNLAPVVINPSDQNGVEGDVVSLQIEAIDGEGDGMTFTASNLPVGLSIDMSTGLISGTITAGASTNSPFAVEITVTDDGSPSESSTVTFIWNVTDVIVVINEAPEVVNPGAQSGVEGEEVSFQILATDDDNLTFTADNLPDGLTIDISTGVISGTIAAGASDNSPYSVTVTVTDDGTPSETSTVNFEWSINQNETYDATMDNMVISPNPASENAEVFINLEVPAPLLGIYIYDTSGRLVKKYEYLESFNGNGSYELYIGDLRNEIYTVYAYVQGVDTPLVKKLVVRN